MANTSTDWRALCAELVSGIDNYDFDLSSTQQDYSVLERARAALAQPEQEGPTDEEILALSQWHEVSYTLSDGSVVYPMQEGTDMKDAVLSFTRAVLTRWGRPATAQPEPEGPTDNEIEREAIANANTDDEYRAFKNGAFFVQEHMNRPAIKPVPVGERPWEREGWCDTDGRCWWGRPSEELCNSDWFLATRAEVEEFCDCSPPVVSLPHHALPVPTTRREENYEA